MGFSFIMRMPEGAEAKEKRKQQEKVKTFITVASFLIFSCFAGGTGSIIIFLELTVSL